MIINNPHLCQPNWPVKKVLAFNTTRLHPLTDCLLQTRYDGFNLGAHVGDDITRVESNRAFLKRLLPGTSQIQWLEQVHGNAVAMVERHSAQPLVADAAITRNPDIALAVMIADCLPVLLSCDLGEEIAVIHGGWRPLLSGIIANTLQQMKSPNARLHAWLGPCIGEQAFEVGAEVRQAFVSQSPAFELAFHACGQGKYLADLSLMAQLQLNSFGVKHIYRVNQCTYNMAQRYYSYRRDGVTGRMAAVISRI